VTMLVLRAVCAQGSCASFLISGSYGLSSLQSGARGDAGVPETPKPGDTRLASSSAIVVGSNRIAAQEALRNLTEHGYAGRVHTLSLVGDVEAAAAQVVAVARSELAVGGPRCVILAGETTVQFGGAVAAGTAGKGGRCSHMALLVAQALSGVPNWCAPFGSEPACEAADTRTHTHTHTHTHVCTVSSLACASLEKLCAQSADRGSLSYVLP
jgi:hypothetical protein